MQTRTPLLSDLQRFERRGADRNGARAGESEHARTCYFRASSDALHTHSYQGALWLLERYLEVEVHPGDAAGFFYQVTNNDPVETFSGVLSVASTNTSRQPDFSGPMPPVST